MYLIFEWTDLKQIFVFQRFMFVVSNEMVYVEVVNLIEIGYTICLRQKRLTKSDNQSDQCKNTSLVNTRNFSLQYLNKKLRTKDLQINKI